MSFSTIEARSTGKTVAPMEKLSIKLSIFFCSSTGSKLSIVKKLFSPITNNDSAPECRIATISF